MIDHRCRLDRQTATNGCIPSNTQSTGYHDKQQPLHPLTSASRTLTLRIGAQATLQAAPDSEVDHGTEGSFAPGL
jgi:hypothetical protein